MVVLRGGGAVSYPRPRMFFFRFESRAKVRRMSEGWMVEEDNIVQGLVFFFLFRVVDSELGITKLSNLTA